MEKIKLTKIHYIVEPHEVRIIKRLLDYAWHRLEKHHNSGLKGLIKLEDVEKLRKEI